MAIGGGEYWENEALRAKIDGFGTRYNGDEVDERYYNGDKKTTGYNGPLDVFAPIPYVEASLARRNRRARASNNLHVYF